jgi:hypothetical protein
MTRLLVLIEQEIESRIEARTRLTRNRGGIVTGILLMGGATGLLVLAVRGHSLQWLAVLATMLYIIGTVCIGLSSRKTRRDAGGTVIND